MASPPVAGAYIDFGPRAAGRRAEGKGRDVASRVEPSRETETETVVEDTRADSSLSFLSLSLFFSRRIQFKIRFERESGKLFLKLSLSDSGFLISEENSRVDLISPFPSLNSSTIFHIVDSISNSKSLGKNIPPPFLHPFFFFF